MYHNISVFMVKSQHLRESLALTRKWCADQLGVTPRAISWYELREKEHYRQFLFQVYADICAGKHSHLPPEAIAREMSRRAFVDYFMNLE
jgi:DNA-binding XRE family transcriptional regulator